MNCFHFSVSLGYKTTRRSGYKRKVSCELLSFFSIFGIQNNSFKNGALVFTVVNCFHFSVSLGYKTTASCLHPFKLLLWIAFIFQYLWDTKQLLPLILEDKHCCELLSFFSIFGIQNNSEPQGAVYYAVVNCFHFSVSLGYKTTEGLMFINSTLLWIAFIFQYLWDTKQQNRL